MIREIDFDLIRLLLPTLCIEAQVTISTTGVPLNAVAACLTFERFNRWYLHVSATMGPALNYYLATRDIFCIPCRARNLRISKYLKATSSAGGWVQRWCFWELPSQNQFHFYCFRSRRKTSVIELNWEFTVNSYWLMSGGWKNRNIPKFHSLMSGQISTLRSHPKIAPRSRTFTWARYLQKIRSLDIIFLSLGKAWRATWTHTRNFKKTSKNFGELFFLTN